MSNDKIDFVITWVDGSDEKWIEKKNKYCEQKEDESNSKIRYRDWGLLKYWFRSVEKYALWVNKIFFITDNQIPQWLNVNNEKLQIVNHTDFIPKECLPTFNSNTIELYINKIKDLSETFVYFNDDMFITDYMTENDFFKNGLPKDSLIFNAVSSKGENDIIEHSILNNMEIISRYYDKKQFIKDNFGKVFNLKYGKGNIRNFLLMPWKYFTGIENQHVPISYLKSTFDEVWDKEYDNLYETTKHKFRCKLDCNHWVFRYWQLFSSKFVPTSLKRCKFYELKKDNSKIMSEIKDRKYKLVCINDSSNNYDFENEKKKIIETFDKILPEKSTFER